MLPGSSGPSPFVVPPREQGLPFRPNPHQPSGSSACPAQAICALSIRRLRWTLRAGVSTPSISTADSTAASGARPTSRSQPHRRWTARRSWRCRRRRITARRGSCRILAPGRSSQARATALIMSSLNSARPPYSSERLANVPVRSSRSHAHWPRGTRTRLARPPLARSVASISGSIVPFSIFRDASPVEAPAHPAAASTRE